MHHTAIAVFPSHRSTLWFLPLIAFCLITSACASTNLAPISTSGAAFDPLPDELDLWEASREEERALLTDVRVVHHPAIQLYLEELVQRLESPGMAANHDVRYQVTILDDPTLNAFAYPHGSIFVHSGLLAEAETEDHVAAILAHEMTHIEHRHMLRHERAKWNRMLPIGLVSMGVALALSIEEVDAWDEGDYHEAEVLAELSDDVMLFGLELASRVTAKGYGRNLEREADWGMMSKLQDNGYDLESVAAFYSRLGQRVRMGDPQVSLAHGLGADLPDRLRHLQTSSGATTVVAAPLLTAEQLAGLWEEALLSGQPNGPDDRSAE